MIKRILKILAGLTAVLVLSVLALAWWYLDMEEMQAPELPGRMEPGSVVHQGHSRSWSAYIPAELPGHAPLVLVLHGSRGSGEQMLVSTRYSFNVLAERQGFVVAYPNGYEQHWNDCRGSASYSANVQDIDDVGFFRALVQDLASSHDIDLSRIYVTGISNGGQMAYRMGFEAPDLVAGIAAVAASMPVDNNLDCERSGLPVAAMVINGTEDPVNPYGGGLVEIAGDASRGTVLSTGATGRYWADLAGYEGPGVQRVWPEQSADDGTTIQSSQWSQPGNVPVTVISVVGGGHTMPHPVFRLPRILGRTSHEFDVAEVIWSFFAGEDYVPRKQSL